MDSADPLLDLAGRGRQVFKGSTERVKRMATVGSIGPAFDRASKERVAVLSKCLAELRSEINGLSAFVRHFESTLKEECAAGERNEMAFHQEVHAEALKIAEPVVASEIARVEALRLRQQNNELPSLFHVAEETLPTPAEIRASYVTAAKRELERRLTEVAIEQHNRSATEDGKPELPPVQDESLPEHLQTSRILLHYGRFIDVVRDHEERFAEQCSRTRSALSRLRMLCEEARGEVATLSQKQAIELLQGWGHHKIKEWHMGEARKRFARGEVTKVLESWDGPGREVTITLRSVLAYHEDLVREGISEGDVAKGARALREARSPRPQPSESQEAK